MTDPIQTDAELREALNRVRAEVGKAVVGQDGAITGLIIALLADGHVLLEGVPGVAKTLLVRTLSRTLRLETRRLQFTPDLMPGDVTGSLAYDPRSGEFAFREGPIFTNLLLADEINRTPPKTQSALLEAMEERQVSADGVTRPLPDPFLVAATQNPIEYEGTYSLPEAQLDRFLVKTSLGYPDAASTRRILEGQAVGTEAIAELILPQAVGEMIALARLVTIEPAIVDYITRLVEATRDAAQTRLGASVRGAIALANISRTWAIAHGRPYVIPDDVKAMAVPVLAHRLILDPEAEFDGVTPESVIGQILLDTAPPTQGAVA